MKINDSVNPTVATASEPSFETKYISMITNTDSIIISRTAGTDSNSIALLSFPSVKSCSVPETASITSLRNSLILFAITIFFLLSSVFVLPALLYYLA